MASVLQNNLKSPLGCIDSAADILGQKWTALILCGLIDRPKRFCELERTISSINPRILSRRLLSLEQQKVIINQGCYYELTAKGRDLLPILKQMVTWSDKYPKLP